MWANFLALAFMDLQEHQGLARDCQLHSVEYKAEGARWTLHNNSSHTTCILALTPSEVVTRTRPNNSPQGTQQP